MNIRQLCASDVTLRDLLKVAQKKKDPGQATMEELARIVAWSVPIKPVRDIPSFVPKFVPALTN